MSRISGQGAHVVARGKPPAFQALCASSPFRCARTRRRSSANLLSCQAPPMAGWKPLRRTGTSPGSNGKAHARDSCPGWLLSSDQHGRGCPSISIGATGSCPRYSGAAPLRRLHGRSRSISPSPTGGRQRGLQPVDRSVAGLHAFDPTVQIGCRVRAAIGGQPLRQFVGLGDAVLQRVHGGIMAVGPKGSSLMILALSGALASSVGAKT